VENKPTPALRTEKTFIEPQSSSAAKTVHLPFAAFAALWLILKIVYEIWFLSYQNR